MTDFRISGVLEDLQLKVRFLRPVPGGDINDGFHIQLHSGEDFFLKVNRRGAPAEIITTEYEGLLLLKSHEIRNIPRQVRLVHHKDTAALLMPFYKKSNEERHWEAFYTDLARMHKVTNPYFGGKDNYIGRLTQNNTPAEDWSTFFIGNRLEPQIKRVKDQGWLPDSVTHNINTLYRNIPSICPAENPALIHGDLWSGNILPTDDQILIIDACPHFGHREMDLAMMQLFGGFTFDKSFERYRAVYPLWPGFQTRMEIYQLYYLLVHLNIFGTTYRSQVLNILRKFT